jgi:organic radical activating enzyme
MNIIQAIKSLFTKSQPLSEGFHVYHSDPNDSQQYRLHLRIEPNGRGLLVVNASTVLHLNQTATEFVYQMIQGNDDDQIIKNVSKRYIVDKNQIMEDLMKIKEQIFSLINSVDLDPVSYLDMEREIPYSELSRPLRLDCALTYQIEGDDISSTPLDRVSKELSTEEWKVIIDKAFQVGIPHLLFTGGEPTLRGDLVQILAHAENLGLVTGLLTQGSNLLNLEYLLDLLKAGLDHIMYILDVDNDSSWKALELILKEDVFTTAHLTLKPGTDLREAIMRLAKIEVNALSLSTSDINLSGQLNELQELASEHQIKLVWDMPVPYSDKNPIAFEIPKEEKTEGAANAWLYVEPDGDVLPEQGVNKVLGNILTSSWEEIFKQRFEGIT